VPVMSLGGSEAAGDAARGLYMHLTTAGIEVLYDNRGVRSGEIFADADRFLDLEALTKEVAS
jgi:hypothetical protein